MKFEVGDVLVDAGRDPEEPLMSAVVREVVENDTGGYYLLQFHEAHEDWLEAEEVEYEWRKAPTGSVGWLIQKLSKHDPLDTVFYTDDSTHWERITDVEERYDGGVSVC